MLICVFIQTSLLVINAFNHEKSELLLGLYGFKLYFCERANTWHKNSKIVVQIVQINITKSLELNAN